MGDPELLTTAQVLELLQIGRTKLWELVRDGCFPAYRIGDGRNAALRYPRSEVMRWLEGNCVNEARSPREEATAPAPTE